MFGRSEHLVLHVQEAVVGVQAEITVGAPCQFGLNATVPYLSRVDVHRAVADHSRLNHVVAVDVKQV